MKRFSDIYSSFLKKTIKKLDFSFLMLYNLTVKKQKRVPE